MSENTTLNYIARLIQSLSMNEKRYFKIYASLHTIGESNNYIKLFDFISQQSTYDETAIKKAFANQKFVKNLHRTKNYLYELILKSLESFHKSISVEYQIRSNLNKIEILHSKNLLQDARKIWKKSVFLARENYKYTYELELLKWYKKIFIGNEGYKLSIKNISELIDQEKEVIKLIGAGTDLSKLDGIIFILSTQQGVSRDLNSIQKLKEEISFTLKKIKPDYLPLPYKIAYYRTIAYYYREIRNFKESLKNEMVALNLMESDSTYLNENKLQYLSTINTGMVRTLQSSSLEAYRLFKEKLEKFPQRLNVEKKSRLENVYFFLSSTRLIEFYLYTGDLQKGEQFAHQVIQRYDQYKRFEDHQLHLVLYYNLFYFFFCKGSLDKAFGWINKITNYPAKNVQQDLQALSRILFILVHYELNNKILLENLIKSTYRNLSRSKLLYKSETVILSFMKKELKNFSSKKTTIKNLLDLKHNLLTLEKNIFENNFLSHFNFIAWIDSKLKGVKIADILRR